MRRAIGIALVLLALAGMLLASIAEAGMLPGGAMTGKPGSGRALAMMPDGDCPHHLAGSTKPVGPAAGKALAFMPCCFGIGGAAMTVAAADLPVPRLDGWLRPASDTLPVSGSRSPEPPPPRA